MLAREKAHPTKAKSTKKTVPRQVEIIFRGSPKELQKLRLEAKKIGVEEVGIPAAEVQAEFADNIPGTNLQGARFREGFTQVELSQGTGIPQRHISEMENGKRPIGKELARRLADALGVDYRVFL